MGALPAGVRSAVRESGDFVRDHVRGFVRQRARAVTAAAAGARDRGLSTIEVVILAPVMILFILVLVAFGQLVDGRGAIDGAARDAARAGWIPRRTTPSPCPRPARRPPRTSTTSARVP